MKKERTKKGIFRKDIVVFIKREMKFEKKEKKELVFSLYC